MGAFFATLALDILVLQESPEGYAAEVAALADLSHVVTGEGRAILSRTPLEDVRHVQLRAGRSFSRATSVIEGLPFSIYCVHIGWNAEGDRQARELIDEHVALDPLPHFIMAGDFNDEHFSSQNNILEEVGTDVWTAIGMYPGERISWPSTAFDGSEGSQLIDLIFYRNIFPAIVLQGEIFNTAPVLSDHKPVFAELLYSRSVDAPFFEDPFAERRDQFSALGQLPPNLLLNGNAESGTDGWAIEGRAEAATERKNQRSIEAFAFFTGYDDSGDQTVMQSSGSQVVDLSGSASQIDTGLQELVVSGWIATGFNTVIEDEVVSNFVRPYDEGELIVEVLDAADRTIVRKSSGRRDTLGWFPYTDVFSLPPGARRARVTFMSHRKPTSGEGNDAVFDDLYLTMRPSGPPNSMLAGNLLLDDGAELGGGAWSDLDDRTGWRILPSGAALGLMLFPPQSYSGRAYFFAGAGELGLDGWEGTREMSQTIALDGFENALEDDRLALRFGGRFRTNVAKTSLRIGLEIFDGDGVLWGVLEPEPIRAAEWTKVDLFARIPRGAKNVRFVLRADAAPAGEAVFADNVYAIPMSVNRR